MDVKVGRILFSEEQIRERAKPHRLPAQTTECASI